MSDEQQIEPRIVSAVGTATAATTTGNDDLASLLEAAMSHAVLKALADGVSIEDSETILTYKLDAHDQLLQAWEQGWRPE